MFALPVDYAAPKLPQPSTTPLTHLPTDLELPTALSEYAHARVKACTMRGASALITAWSIPATMLLNDYQLQWFLSHRLGIAFPAMNGTPLLCHPRCFHIGKEPASYVNRPDLFLTADLLIHYLGCGVLGLSLQRHNLFCRILVGAVTTELGVKASFIEKLASDEATKRQVDAVYHAWSQIPATTAVDATVACVLLEKHIKEAVKSAHAIFITRDKQKRKKHRYYSNDEEGDRQFISIVATTFGGLGPKSFWTWFDTAFKAAVANDIAAGNSGRSALQRKSYALQLAQASLIKSTAAMVAELAHTA